MQQVAKFDWQMGGISPPAIGPYGDVYAIADNTLHVFRACDFCKDTAAAGRRCPRSPRSRPHPPRPARAISRIRRARMACGSMPAPQSAATIAASRSPRRSARSKAGPRPTSTTPRARRCRPRPSPAMPATRTSARCSTSSIARIEVTDGALPLGPAGRRVGRRVAAVIPVRHAEEPATRSSARCLAAAARRRRQHRLCQRRDRACQQAGAHGAEPRHVRTRRRAGDRRRRHGLCRQHAGQADGVPCRRLAGLEPPARSRAADPGLARHRVGRRHLCRQPEDGGRHQLQSPGFPPCTSSCPAAAMRIRCRSRNASTATAAPVPRPISGASTAKKR